MSWNNSAPLDRTQTVSSQSSITSSFSTFMRVLFSLKHDHQYLNKRRMNAKTISQIHTDNLYQGFYLLLHAIASLIYIRDGKEGLQEKSVTGKWISRRLLLNYLVRFQKKEKEITHTETNQERRAGNKTEGTSKCYKECKCKLESIVSSTYYTRARWTMLSSYCRIFFSSHWSYLYS